MATGSGGGGSSGGVGSSGPAGASGAAGAPVKAGDVEVLAADGKSQGVFNDGKPATPNIRLDSLEGKPPQNPGIRLESLGKGASTADLDLKTNEVVIRRSGKIVERFDDEKSVAEFAERKRLSDVDRELLAKLNALRRLQPSAREDARRLFGDSAPERDVALTNVLAQDATTGRIRAEIERNDADVFARVEQLRKARQARPVEPADPVPASIAAARAGQAAEARSDDTIQRESPFASPNAKIRVIPAEIGAQYVKAGNKYLHSNDTRAVAFVDRGDKLETPSSAPQVARSLVAIAEARGWDELRVKGTDGFRREVWLEASSRGIHVDGYKPSEVDKAELEKRNAFARDHNVVEKRSEVFKSASPQQGVRQDPTLASAYGAMRHAEAVSEKLHPDTRASFIKQVKESVAHKLDANEPIVAPKIRVADGKLIEHGAANYNFDKDEKPSYYVKLRDEKGRELTQWGVGLQAAVKTAEAQRDDTVQLRVTESKGVVVEGNVRDGEGRIIGRKTVDAHRNEWQVIVTERERAAERQVEQERVR